MKTLFYFTVTVLALTGCVSTVPPKLSESHPANPHAPQSPVPAPTPMLVAGARQLVLPVSTNEMEMMQHGEHQKMQMPPSESAQPPAQHKHGHKHQQEENK